MLVKNLQDVGVLEKGRRNCADVFRVPDLTTAIRRALVLLFVPGWWALSGRAG